MLIYESELTLNQRVPGSSPGAPTISTENTDTYEDRPGCHLRDQPSGHTGVTDRHETHEQERAGAAQRGAVPRHRHADATTDPLIYRFYELIMVNGPALKALIEEEFGDGIMSAIDFDMTL